MIGDGGLIEALDDFVQKAGDDETLGNGHGNAAGPEVKHFVLVDLPGRGAMGATNIIGQNLKSGHGVRLRVVTQKKISHLLISVGEMGVRLDSDQAAEGAARAVIE